MPSPRISPNLRAFAAMFPDWKVCFLRAEDIFHSQICALGKTTLASPPHMKWVIFQVHFSNSARFIGRCAHGSLLARGRSSARTTYFPLWQCLLLCYARIELHHLFVCKSNIYQDFDLIFMMFEKGSLTDNLTLKL